MPNIPTRERPSMPARQNMPPRNQPVRPNSPSMNGPRPNGPSRNTPPRVVYDPRRAPSANINYKQLQRPTVRNGGERINPIRPTKKALQHLSAILPKKTAKKKKKKQYKERTVTHEFMLGFFVGLLIFGVAAIFICTALIGLFT